MNKQDIDSLSGYALNVAVATVIGWTQDAKRKRWWTDATNRPRLIMFDDDNRTPATYLFNPASSIATAWDLDGENYRWEFEEHYLFVESPVVLARCLSDSCYTSEARFSDFSTKAEAYAAARCRAWLKAKLAEATR